MAPIARENATSGSGESSPSPTVKIYNQPPTRMHAFQIRFITAEVGRRILRALACLFTSQYVNISFRMYMRVSFFVCGRSLD